MSWGTPVMLLGRIPGRPTGTALGAAARPVEAVEWGFLLGSYVGAWVGGAAIGYVIGKKPAAAITGGMAASGVWSIGETIAYARSRHPVLSAVFVAMGVGSLVLAWKRR